MQMVAAIQNLAAPVKKVLRRFKHEVAVESNVTATGVFMKVLLAEDDPNISVIAKLALEKIGGFTVTVVSDGETALNTALTGDFDIILLDEMMPKMNGVRVCQEYKARCQNPRPVVFLSAKSQDSDIKEFFSEGDGFIPKPFDPTTLHLSVEAIFKRSKAA